MSYAVMGFGAVESFGVQWPDGYGNQSAVVMPKGPECGWQIAAQVMLRNLGFGAGKPNMKDPTWLDAVAQYAQSRGIPLPPGSPPSDAVCARLLTDWQAMAAPTPPTPGKGIVWILKPGAAPPAPKACPPGWDWIEASQRCAAAPAPSPTPVAPQILTPVELPPGPPVPSPPAVPTGGMSPRTKLMLAGGALLLVIGVVAMAKS